MTCCYVCCTMHTLKCFLSLLVFTPKKKICQLVADSIYFDKCVCVYMVEVNSNQVAAVTRKGTYISCIFPTKQNIKSIKWRKAHTHSTVCLVVKPHVHRHIQTNIRCRHLLPDTEIHMRGTHNPDGSTRWNSKIM